MACTPESEEIEVTREMAIAGSWLIGDARLELVPPSHIELARQVYIAMDQARRAASERAPKTTPLASHSK